MSNPVLRSLVYGLACLCAVVSVGSSLRADERDGELDFYFIDVEGGAATLIVTPEGESILIDSGYPDNKGRDRDRILKVVRDVAGRKQIDHAMVSHWHLDHYGNHAALASLIPIKHFWDRGIPETLQEDKEFPTRIANYRAASQNQSKTLKAGDMLPFKSGKTPLSVKVVTASGDVIPNSGETNPYAGEHKPQPEDTSDNARSVSLLLKFGEFTFLTCGDLTWNVEAKLMTPSNPLGKIDVFMVTHHGLHVSNNPVLVKAIDPRVAIICNGPTKGGNLETQQTLKQVKSLAAVFQLHRNLGLKPDQQAPAELIANDGKTEDCQGEFISTKVSPDGKSYRVRVGNQKNSHVFRTR